MPGIHEMNGLKVCIWAETDWAATETMKCVKIQRQPCPEGARSLQTHETN